MKTIDKNKSAYQIKREKAGRRFGVLGFFLLLLITLANVDNVMAAPAADIRIDGFGYSFSTMKERVQQGGYGEVAFVEHMGDEQLLVANLAGSNIIVLDGINDLAGFFELVEQLPRTLVVVVGESLFGQGLMLDNLIMTHSFVADDTLVAMLKMLTINPAMSHAQIRHGLFGENVYDQIALEQSGKVIPVDLKQAENYALSTVHEDREAPRVVKALKAVNGSITASIEDNQGVAYVEMYVGDTFVARDYEAPFEFSISEKHSENVSLVAYDSAANSSRYDITR